MKAPTVQETKSKSKLAGESQKRNDIRYHNSTATAQVPLLYHRLIELSSETLNKGRDEGPLDGHTLPEPAEDPPSAPSRVRRTDDELGCHPAGVDPVLAVCLASRVEQTLEGPPAVLEEEMFAVRDCDARVGVDAAKRAREGLAQPRREDEQSRVVDDVRVGKVTA